MLDNQPGMEQRAKSLILNYQQAQDWYPLNSAQRGLYEFVLITTSALESVAADLVDWEIIKGRTATVVTTEWIGTNYTGVDLAQKIRNFLREKYPTAEWGIEDVCLVGAMANVPMRHVYDDPDTDLYYAELSLPDNQSWDANSNQEYLGPGDSTDFYSEVNIGRIPWSTVSIVQHIVEKTIAFEMTDDPSFKKNVLLIGTYFWDDTDNAVMMEAKVDQPGMEDWTMTRMYEVPQSSYPSDYNASFANVQSVWSTNTFAFVNWAGHGSATECYELYPSQPFVDTTICPLLDDNFPAIIFADACSNSETSEISIGARMMERGGVGFVGSTRIAYGCPGWSGPMDGSSQSLDYFFSSGVMSGGMTQGEAMQYALTQVYQMNGWDYPEMEMCEWTLYGNPNLGMQFALSSDGTVMFDAAKYKPDSFAVVTVRDLDLDENPGGPDTVPVALTSDNGDAETFILTETGNSTFIFQDTVTISQGTAVPGNGILEVQHGNQIQAVYIDEDDGHGGVNLEKTITADIDSVPPVISNVEVSEISDSEAVIHWTTDEESDSTVFYGIGTPSESAVSLVRTTSHSVVLTGLQDCTQYVFYVESTDAAGNTAADDNYGSFYALITYELVVFLDANMNTNPGWTYQGQWAWGDPSGSGGDPSSGNTDSNVVGYNLNGTYTNNMSATYCTTQTMDCSEADQVFLSYYYWLGIESSTWDHASVQVSGNGGSSWTTLWDHTGSTFIPSSWSYSEFDISSVAGGSSNVQIRWVMGTTDSSVVYCGWNLDDVLVSYATECTSVPTPTPVPTATPNECLNTGDVNADSELTAGDAQLAFQIALGTHTPTYQEECSADCNGDDEVTAGDAQGIFMAALGLGSCVDPL